MEEVELPPGLSLAVGLDTAVDLETASVGDPVTGGTQADVKYKGRVIVPKGALVSGRLRRIEKYTDPAPYFAAGLEFSEVAFTGYRARFFAAMEKIGAPPGLELIEKLSTPSLLGVGTGIGWKTLRCDPEWSPRRDESAPHPFDPLPRR